MTLAQVGLVNRTPTVLQACLQQAPEQPLGHFMLGQPLTLKATLTWLRQASRRDARYADVADVLTAYGRIALQCEEVGMSIEILAPLYEIVGEPRQAYYLAQAYRARCQQAESEPAALADCERAITLARHALESDLHRAYAEVVLAQLEEDRERLLAAQLLDMPQPDHKLGETEDMTELQAIPSEASTLEMQASQGEKGMSTSVKRSGWMRNWWSGIRHRWLQKLGL